MDNRRTIAYLDNLPIDVTINDIYQYFGKYGKILRLKFLNAFGAVFEGIIEYPTGIALLMFETEKELMNCIVDETPIIISGHIVEKYDSPQIIRYRMRNSAFLFFKSLYDTYEKIIQKLSLFNIVSCQILHSVQCNKPGFAIIEFISQQERTLAIENNSNEIFNIQEPLYIFDLFEFEDEDDLPHQIIYPDTKNFLDIRSFQRWYDFEIKYLENIYKVNSFLASTYSKKIHDILLNNSNLYNYNCKIKQRGPFELIIKSLMSHDIYINTDNSIFLLLCGIELEMDKLIESCYQIINDMSNSEKIFYFVNELCKNNLNYDNHVKYITQNFELFKDDTNFKSLLNDSSDVIIAVFNSLPISIKESSQFADYLLSFVSYSTEARAKLISCIPFHKMDAKKIRNILSEPGINMNFLRDSIIKLLKNGIDPEEEKPIEIIEKPFIRSKYDGIFNFIKESFGLPASEIIEVNSTNDLPNIIDPNWTKYWISPIIQQMWLEIDVDPNNIKKLFFIPGSNNNKNSKDSKDSQDNKPIFRKIKVIAYTLKTIPVQDGGHLKSWVLEGKNDNKDWIILDEQKKSTSLKGPNKFSTFIIKKPSEPVRYIRLRQTDKNYSDNDSMSLQALELFGEVYEGNNQDKKDVFKYERGKEWYGFFDNLSKNLGNPIYNKKISIKSAASPNNLINYGWNGYWKSPDIPNSFVSFRFPGMKIELEAYTLKSPPIGKTFPITWVVEGSNDGAKWFLIDEQKNITSLCSNNAQIDFKCQKSNLFEYIRIKQTGKNKAGTDGFYLSFVEFYGKIHKFHNF